jgi:Spy/CpxP family protein refolding chaperone
MKKFASVFLSLFAAGILSAQTAPAAHHRAGGGMIQRLSAQLNLTADQQAQARAIFQQSREQMKAIAPQLKAERQAMQTAVKADNEGQIDAIVHQNAAFDAQNRAIHAKAMAKFYQILTPDQKTKFDQRENRHRIA